MKRMLSVDNNHLNIDIALLIARVGIAGLMLSHGIPKLIRLFSGAPIAFANVGGMGPELSLALAVFAEVICSVFILFGFGTRLAVIPLIITMLVAVFYIHSADPFAKQEPGLYFLLVYILLLIMGSGKFSLDKTLCQGKKKNFNDRSRGNTVNKNANVNIIIESRKGLIMDTSR